jgi:glycerophosphoryl diester phosphodiesterase
VQLSRDGVPVLYRSSDLSALTNSEGKVSSLTAAELAKVDAGWKWGDDSHPWRGKQATIPTLQSVLQQWPHTFFYIDIKSPDADPTVMGERLLAVLKATDSLDRVRVYSTEDRYIAALPPAIPASSPAAKPAPGLPIFRSAISASQRATRWRAVVWAGAEAQGRGGGEIHPWRRDLPGDAHLG